MSTVTSRIDFQPRMEIPELTGLRGLASWWVVAYHFRQFFGAAPEFLKLFFAKGYLAVDLFFILSGFVIYVSNQSLAQTPSIGLFKIFIVRRWRRIYPLHLFMLCIFIVIPISILLYSTKKTIPLAYSIESFFANIMLVQNWGLLNYLSWNIPAWAVSSEFLAYLLFPFLGGVIYTFRNRASVLISLFILLGIALGALFNLRGAASLGDDIPHLGAIRCLLEFTLGCLLGAIYLQSGSHIEAYSKFGLYTSALLVATYISLDIHDYWVMPLVFSTLILSLCSHKGITARLLRSKPLRFLGLISYSTYMVHMFVREVFKLVFVLDINDTHLDFSALVCIAIVFIASVALYYSVERPSLYWSRQSVRDPNGEIRGA